MLSPFGIKSNSSTQASCVTKLGSGGNFKGSNKFNQASPGADQSVLTCVPGLFAAFTPVAVAVVLAPPDVNTIPSVNENALAVAVNLPLWLGLLIRVAAEIVTPEPTNFCAS